MDGIPFPEDLGQGEGLIPIVRMCTLVPTVSVGMPDRAVLGPRWRRAHLRAPPHQLKYAAFPFSRHREHREPATADDP